jgi:hypothetical protein
MSELRPVRCDLCRSSGWLFSGQLQTLAERDDLERQLVEVIVMANKSIRAELLLHAEGLRCLANRARTLAGSISSSSDDRNLLRHARRLDDIANRLDVEVSPEVSDRDHPGVPSAAIAIAATTPTPESGGPRRGNSRRQ